MKIQRCDICAGTHADAHRIADAMHAMPRELKATSPIISSYFWKLLPKGQRMIRKQEFCKCWQNADANDRWMLSLQKNERICIHRNAMEKAYVALRPVALQEVMTERARLQCTLRQTRTVHITLQIDTSSNTFMFASFWLSRSEHFGRRGYQITEVPRPQHAVKRSSSSR